MRASVPSLPLRSHHRHHPPPIPATADHFRLIRRLCFSGRLREAIHLLYDPRFIPSSQTYSFLLQETINRRNSLLARTIHSHIITTNFPLDTFLTTKLLISYSKVSGDLHAAHHLFNAIPHRTIVAWNSMISGYTHKGMPQDALHLYYSMRAGGLAPDQYTFASVFRACAKMAVLGHGKRAHCLLVKSQKGVVEGNVVVSCALLDMYFKCCSPEDGRRVFECSLERNVFSWTALISGYGQHGRVTEVLQMFQRMVGEGYRPNHVTFLAVLSACSRGGLVDAGCKYFSSMTRDYGISPKGEHYAAVADMLGRAGRLNEAFEFVARSPCEGHSSIWGALLGACRIHGDVELVKMAAEKFFIMDPVNTGKYIVLSNTYAASEMWEDAADIRGRIETSGMKKEPAWSSIEVRGEVHTFFVRDKSHEQSESISDMLYTLASALAEAGYA